MYPITWFDESISLLFSMHRRFLFMRYLIFQADHKHLSAPVKLINAINFRVNMACFALLRLKIKRFELGRFISHRQTSKVLTGKHVNC